MTPQEQAIREGIARVQEQARAATPGPWHWTRWGAIDAGEYDTVAEVEVECMSYCYGGTGRLEVSEPDKAHIAAHDPASVLAQCDRDLAELDAALAQGARHLLSSDVCPTCWALPPCPDAEDSAARLTRLAERYGATT